MYHIGHLCPRSDISLGRHGFSIYLSVDFRDAVKASGMTQVHANRHIDQCGREWLDACGFGTLGFDGTKLYDPRYDLRISWGDWGPEHITVPGNACGLDIDRDCFAGIFKDGMTLLPHNVDSERQKLLLLIVFTEMAQSVLLFKDHPLKAETTP